MPTRRTVLLASAGALLGTGPGAAPAAAHGGPGRWGRYGSPTARLDPRTLYVDPEGHGDHTTVQAAVTATPTGTTAETGWTLVLAPGTYRETVTVPPSRPHLTLIGASRRARDTVLVYDNAAGTPKPGGGTLGTTGSATAALQADGLTAYDITFANDWLRADHPGSTGTQAVAAKVTGDRCAFHRCRFLGHQDTLYADTAALAVTARQYYGHCHIEGDVDFVFGRATAVLEHCRLHTLGRTDLAAPPLGFVFAPSTARTTAYGFLATRCTVTSAAADGAYRLARPWVPSSDPTARPMLTVRGSWLGPGVDAATPYATMSNSYPWQQQRFAEYANEGPGALIADPAERPQLTAAQAGLLTRESHLLGADGWRPWDDRPSAGRTGGDR
ncbi:pectinesterase family protein [Kitasatospora sp. KL5]|uniref:pectinesterase family protein n=1 Tax=Kitasatospora sp. KL5 TaxID=3425125 RepID=UPI003D6E19F7